MAEEKGWCNSHMKTHFVLNTLGNIQYLIRKRPEEAAEMMETFIDYTKASLRYEQQGNWNTLEKELEYVKEYGILMQMRFHEQFQVAYEISPIAMELPPFTLQGLVENAFYHGVRSLGEDGRITIHTYTTEEENVLEVQDNGQGITDVDATIREAITQNSFLGQLNAALSKSEKTAWKIQSVPNEGTIISIRIHL